MIFDLDLYLQGRSTLFWLGIQHDSIVWVIMRQRGYPQNASVLVVLVWSVSMLLQTNCWSDWAQFWWANSLWASFSLIGDVPLNSCVSWTLIIQAVSVHWQTDHWFNLLWPNDTILWHRSGSTLVQGLWLVVWLHQTITWINVDKSSVRSCGIYPRAISQEVMKMSICKMSLKIALSKLLPHFDGILPKGPYLPCLRMADRALLAGYPQIFPAGNELNYSPVIIMAAAQSWPLFHSSF